MIDKNGKEITNYDIQKEMWKRCMSKKEPYIAHSDLTGAIYVIVGNDKYDVTEQVKKALPSVIPTRKKGKWIDTKETSTNRKGQILHEVICSKCNGISYFRGMDGKYIGANLCPNCGIEMEIEQ